MDTTKTEGMVRLDGNIAAAGERIKAGRQKIAERVKSRQIRESSTASESKDLFVMLFLHSSSSDSCATATNRRNREK